MNEVIETEGCSILFPSVQTGKTVTHPLLLAIKKQAGQTPFIGTLPNRFKAEVTEDFDPHRCVDAIQKKWEKLASTVWDNFMPLQDLQQARLTLVPKKKRDNLNAQDKTLTETLWEQQVKGFWDIHWVKGEAPADGSDALWLRKRKTWHQHVQPDQQEPGDACSLMPGWVELSGHIRSRSAEIRDKQDNFWTLVREHVGSPRRGASPDDPGPGRLNLTDKERLCAIAFIKRLWPKLPRTDLEGVLGWVPDDKGKSAGNWPSTAYMAALPWIRQTYNTADAAQRARCENYVKELKAACAARDDEDAKAKGLFSEILNKIEGIAGHPHFCTLDGQLFYEDGLQAAAEEKLLPQSHVKPLQKLLAQIAPGSKPSPFYAVLRMDGDGVGALVASNANAVSSALREFSGKVRDIVDVKHQGATLYAGGDDVLALLPLDKALACAQALQHAYQAAMHGQELVGSISAAIVFAHFHLPLSFVMAESGDLLEDIAKTENGRNSLAVAVYKPGGRHLQWVTCWDAAANTPLSTLMDLAGKFNPGRDAAGHDVPLSSGFLYRIRERWGDLATKSADGQPELQFEQDHVEQLWAADLLANRDLGEVNDDSREKAKVLARQLFTISRDNKNPVPAAPTLLADSGGLLVRFLATKGVRP